VLQMQIGSGSQASRRRFLSLARNSPRLWIPALVLTLLGGFGAATAVRAQTPPAGSASETTAAAQPAATSVTPLGRFVPRDNLIFYVDFDGLDAHAEAWQKTAAYRMLNQTPLGVMLEEVAAQLLDKPLESLPNRKLSGAEIVTLVKLMARKGWVLALNANEKGANPFVGTLVLRGAAAKDKEIKSITSRLIGTLMGPDSKPRIDRKAGRVMVVVPRGSAADTGWVWWPEKEDLVIGFMQPSNSDAIIAALDGKAPSAVDHAILKELARPEGSFVPLMTAILDPTAAHTATGMPLPKMVVFLEQLTSTTGLSRLDYRWGFDDDALMSVSRLMAPAPRKLALAIFDQPPLDTKNLIPMPEGVESFAMMSISPAKALEAISQIGPPGEVKAKIDELMEKVSSQSRIDFDKDLFSNFGPRMAVYLAPGRSAATTDEAPQTPAGLAGLDPMAMLSSLQGALPKPTLVAELRDPVAFGKALDSIMLAVNKELKAQAMEKAVEDGAADEAGKAPGGQGAMQGRGFGRGGVAGEGPGGRPARKRSLKDTPAPEFRLMPGNVKIYMLTVPTDSPLKILPPGMRPTIRLEGNHIAFSSTSEAARAALETVKKKGWKPGPDVEQALSHLPPRPIFLAVGDPRETVPSLLASLPGTLQAQINSAIALSAGGSPGALPGGTGSGQPGAGPGFGPGASAPGSGGPGGGMSLSKPGMAGRTGFPGGSGSAGMAGSPPGANSASRFSRPGFPGGSGGSGPPGAPGLNTSAGAGGSQDAMIQLKVDPGKLPKAEELKALMFPSTLAVVVDDTSIRLISRESFPNVVSGLGIGAAFASGFVPAFNAARANAMAAAGVPPGQSAPAAAPGNLPGAAQPPAATGGPAMPGGPRGFGRGGRPGSGRGPG